MKLMVTYNENEHMPKNNLKLIQGFKVGQGCQSVQKSKKQNLHLKILHDLHVKCFQQKEQTQSRFLYIQ